MIDTVDEKALVATIEEKLDAEALAAAIMNFDSDGIDGYDEMVHALVGKGLYSYAPKKVELDQKNRATPTAKPSIEEPPVLKLKAFPSHLRYAFLGANNSLPITIATDY